MLDKSAPLLVILGPSGAGKTTVIRRLIQDGLVSVTPSWTTRPKREDEQSGAEEHIFCTKEQFDKAKKAGKFLHSVKLFDLPYEYGLPPIPKPPKNKVPLIMLRVMVLAPLFKFYENVIIYEIDAPLKQVEEQLALRNMDGEELGTRLSGYKDEVKRGRAVAHRVFSNQDLESTIEAIELAIAEDFKL